ENTDDLFVGKTLLHGDVLMWLMKTLLTSRCINQRGAGHFIQLDNGDEAFYHNGHFVTCADAGANEASIVDIARQSARAGGMPLRMFELPLPVQEDEEWCWNDVAEALARSAMTESVRASERQ
ncbi:hypothetical protein ACTUSO_23175, partial [Pantoea ananatis]